MKRVVNINFKCEGLDFDAAIDCDNVLKETLKEEYLPEEISEYRTNIELYCFDRSWGVRFIHYEGEPGVVVNDKEPDRFGHYHTVCDMNEIMTAAREWIKEKEEEEDVRKVCPRTPQKVFDRLRELKADIAQAVEEEKTRMNNKTKEL